MALAYNPKDLIGKCFLFRPLEGRSKGELQEGKIVKISSSGNFIQMQALMHSGTGWMTIYDFANKLEILEILGE